ncbi:MAG: alkaline phosphatase [Phycisphaerae bacterium]
MKHFKIVVVAAIGAGLAMLVSSSARSAAAAGDGEMAGGTSVIFIHPDGAGANAWGAARALYVGPDSDLNWDRLENIALYRGHMSDALTATSNGGATTHAYGARVKAKSFGLDGDVPITRDGAPGESLATLARGVGKSVGIVSSAVVYDAGTGVFLARVTERKNYDEIASQMLAFGPEVLLGGGEEHFLPEGVQGRFGAGVRKDGRNLVEEARRAGYVVVYTREELMRVESGTTKLLGLFAAGSTFLDDSEEKKAADKTPYYVETAPTIGEMVEASLKVLSRNPSGFLLVAEEEGSDNYAGKNNTKGALMALQRADEALGVGRAFTQKNPRTLLITCADSDCGGMQVVSDDGLDADSPVPARDSENGAPLDGRDGTGTLPFMAKPDARGRSLPFAIAWARGGDVSGNAVLVRATGYRASDLVKGTLDNVGVHRVMREVLLSP